MEGGALLLYVVQRVTQKLAERQRVEQRRLILRRRRRRGPLPGVGPEIETIGQIDLIGGRAIVTGAASGDSESESQRFQPSRIVSRQLEALDVHRPGIAPL